MTSGQKFDDPNNRGGSVIVVSWRGKIPYSERNVLYGWNFPDNEIDEARNGNRLLNPSIDLSNPCNLNCPYCFVEEKDSERKLRFPDELSIAEIVNIINDFACAGARTVNIVGAGEPTIDLSFKEVIQEIVRLGMVPVVFTNGIRLAEKKSLVEFLYESGATIVLKYNSANPAVQDAAAGRVGYTQTRDIALNSLLNCGYQSHLPTRLAFDIIAFKGNQSEIPEIFRFCRRNNIYPIVADFIPTGRTENGEFVGQASLLTMAPEQRAIAAQLLQPLESIEREALYSALTRIDLEEFGIAHELRPAYYNGAPCTQILGIYVDIHGNIWPCVAKSKLQCNKLVPALLGNVRRGDVPSTIWHKHPWMEEIRGSYDGSCPYKHLLNQSSLLSVDGLVQTRCKNGSLS